MKRLTYLKLWFLLLWQRRRGLLLWLFQGLFLGLVLFDFGLELLSDLLLRTSRFHRGLEPVALDDLDHSPEVEMGEPLRGLPV